MRTRLPWWPPRIERLAGAPRSFGSRVVKPRLSTFGSGYGQLIAPKGLGVDGWGNVFVADTFNSRV